MRKILLFLILIIIIFIPLSLHSVDKEKIIIIIGSGYPPYYDWEDSKPIGMCIEIIENVALNMNIEIVYKTYPWLRCLNNMKFGKADAMLPLFDTPERGKYLWFLENNVLAYEENSLIVRKDSNISYSGNLEDLKHLTIGVLAGYSYGKVFDTADFLKKEKTVIHDKAEKILLTKLLNKRLDIMIANTLVVKHIAKEMKTLDKITILKPYISKDSLYIAFSKIRSRKILGREFGKILKKFKLTKKYQEILKKYGVN